jgi:hypothetical protein
MGLHDTCRNPFHRFDKNKELTAERIGNDIVYWGYCPDCHRLRIVYESELKNPDVIRYKMANKR